MTARTAQVETMSSARRPRFRARPGTAWANLPLRAKGLVVVFLPLAALIVTSFSFLLYQRDEHRARSAVTHASAVESQLQIVLGLVVDAETGARGYLITRQDDFLEPYQRARAELPEALSQLGALMQGPAESRRLATLRSLIDERLRLSERLLRFPPSMGPAPADLIVLLEQGKAATDAVRMEIAALDSDEHRLLAQGESRVEEGHVRLQLTLALGALLGLGGGITAVLLFTRGVVRRVEQLEDNAGRLESGMPLVPIAPGEDEIGRLGRGLARAGDLLIEREGALREARAFLEHLVAASPMVMFRGSGGADDFIVEYISPNVEQLLGYTPEEVVGVAAFLRDLKHPDDRDRLAVESERATAQGAIQLEQELRLRHQDRSYRWIHRVVRREPVGPDATARVLGYLLDVTERREAKEAAEAANRAKSEFLSRMSHELRTPLNAILGFAQLLELKDLTEDERESVSHILKAGRHLLELINEVLDIARIETGRLALSFEPVSVNDVVGETLDLMRPLANRRGLELRDDTGAGGDRQVRADRQRLKQVLLNLASNAVKYNREHGTVTVSCVPASHRRLQIRVRDTGLGIAPDQLGLLFTPFERLGAAQSDVEGSGVGLALSRHLAEAMGGVLGVESDVGEGSTFWVELPVAEESAGEHGRLDGEPVDVSPRANGARRRTVLHIEDNLLNLKLVERVLSQWGGIELIPAMQGRLGLELAHEHQPDLILLDLHLPALDGERVLSRLREDPLTVKIPVIVVSADATPGKRERLLAAGARAYLTKPLDVRELLRLIDEILHEYDPAY